MPEIRHYIKLVEAFNDIQSNRNLNEIKKTLPLKEPKDEEQWKDRSTDGETVGDVDGYEIRLDNMGSLGRYLVILDHDKSFAGFINFNGSSDGYHQVSMMRLSKKLRGKRLIPRAMLMLAKNGMAIESDFEQTDSARKMWQYIQAESAGYGCSVFAKDQGNDRLLKVDANMKTENGRLVYGNTRFTLVLKKD